MFKNIQKYIYAFLFMLIILGPMVSWGILLVLNDNNPQIMQTLDFELYEKRNKATMSSAINLSKITGEIDAYFNDRLPFRSVMISSKRFVDGKLDELYKNYFEKSILKTFAKKRDFVVVNQADEVDGIVYKYMDQAVDIYLNHGLKKDEIDPYDTSIEYPLKYLNNHKVLVGQSDWLYLNEGNIIYYQGLNGFKSEEEIEEHIKPYVKLKKQCDKVGKKFIILICPEKEEIYPEYMPTMEITDEKERPLYIRDYIEKNTDLTYLYPKEEILQAKKNYLTYKKYDSHWNSIGAYVAANKVKEAMGIKTIPLRDLKLTKEKVLDADLAYYGNTSLDSLKETFNYKFEDYKLNNDVEFIFDSNPLTHDFFTSHCDKGEERNVFLIGDSFRTGMQEFFVKDFKEFYCNTFLNASGEFINQEIKRADTIIISLVERNEETTLPALCKMICRVLEDYENDINKFIRENSK